MWLFYREKNRRKKILKNPTSDTMYVVLFQYEDGEEEEGGEEGDYDEDADPDYHPPVCTTLLKLKPIFDEWIFQSLSIGRVHFHV